MRFVPLDIDGAFLIESDPINDDRGSFARTYCRDTFKEHGIEDEFVQCSISTNTNPGTLRGMHFQLPPHAEAKLIRCVRGSVYDVMVDVRPQSSTFKKWVGVELYGPRSVYLPKGMAHGFISLEENSELLYQITPQFTPQSVCGFRWNDSDIGIKWPMTPNVVSAKDEALPKFSEILKNLQLFNQQSLAV